MLDFLFVLLLCLRGSKKPDLCANEVWISSVYSLLTGFMMVKSNLRKIKRETFRDSPWIRQRKRGGSEESGPTEGLWRRPSLDWGEAKMRMVSHIGPLWGPPQVIRKKDGMLHLAEVGPWVRGWPSDNLQIQGLYPWGSGRPKSDYCWGHKNSDFKYATQIKFVSLGVSRKPRSDYS